MSPPPGASGPRDTAAAPRATPAHSTPGLRRRATLFGLALLVAAAAWLPCLHLLFRPAPAAPGADGLTPHAAALLAHQVAVWRPPIGSSPVVDAMRRHNPEWDLMARMYLVLSLANISLRAPADADRHLDLMDALIDHTLRQEESRGHGYFTLAHHATGYYVDGVQRSHFVDSEVALMLAARCTVRPHGRYAALLRGRVALMEQRMQRSPLGLAESYPDECWLFCNSVALASMRLSDRLEGTDRGPFYADWIARAQERLVDPASGLLIAYCRTGGAVIDGPEGSSLWMTVHCLELVDPAFAREQYDRARRLLGRTLLGFGYAREWPGWQPLSDDIDSGPVVPVLGVSAGSSGLAFVAAAGFDDRDFVNALRTTLEFAAFPIEVRGARRYGASNLVGDAVLLYSAVLGPLWDRAVPTEERP